MTQEELAEAADISDRQIRRIEKGECSTGIDTIEALAGALQAEPKELLDFSSI